MTQFNHAFDLAFEVVSEHGDPCNIPAAAIIAGLEKRLATLKADPEQVHEACNGYGRYEAEESVGPDDHDKFADLSEADQRGQSDSAFQIENIQKEN